MTCFFREHTYTLMHLCEHSSWKSPFQLFWTWNLNIFVKVLYNKWIEIFVDLKTVKSSYVTALLRSKILVYSSRSECFSQWFKIFKKTITNIKIKFFLFSIYVFLYILTSFLLHFHTYIDFISSNPSSLFPCTTHENSMLIKNYFPFLPTQSYN